MFLLFFYRLGVHLADHVDHPGVLGRLLRRVAGDPIDLATGIYYGSDVKVFLLQNGSYRAILIYFYPKLAQGNHSILRPTL